MTELLPCPFCGCTNIKYKREKWNNLTDWHYLRCVDCKCAMHALKIENVYEKWNKRHE